MTTIQLELHYTEQLLRDAVGDFFQHVVLERTRLSGFGLVLALICLTIFEAAFGRFDWLFGFACASLLFALSLYFIVYRGHIRHTLSKFRSMKQGNATMTLTEKDFTVTSELGSVTLPWSSVQEVLCQDRYWLVVLSISSFITIPSGSMDEEAWTFIRQRAASL